MFGHNEGNFGASIIFSSEIIYSVTFMVVLFCLYKNINLGE